MQQVGIYSIGVHLPEKVRRNDHWPEEIVSRWRAMARVTSVRPQLQRGGLPPDLERMLRAMSEYEDDPFYGSRERRVMADDERTTDLEQKACEDALARAGIRKDEVGLLLAFSQLPEYLTNNAAALLHQKLGLPSGCLSLSVEAVCNSFLMQLTLAEALIRNGQAKYALLVQSAGLQHLTPLEDQNSFTFGDGATAVLVGPVADGYGLLGKAHKTDGAFHHALVTTVPRKTWWDGRESPIFHAGDPKGVRPTLTSATLSAPELAQAALRQAGLSASDITYYASNQPTPWFRRVSQELIGLERARFVDTYPSTGSLGAGNIPIMLAMGEREGLIADGAPVLAYTSGSGVTYCSVVIRWGRGPKA